MARLGPPAFTMKDLYDSNEFLWQEDFIYDLSTIPTFNKPCMNNPDPIHLDSFPFDTFNCSAIDRSLKMKPYFGASWDARLKQYLAPPKEALTNYTISAYVDPEEDVAYLGAYTGYLAAWKIGDKAFRYITGPGALTGNIVSITKDQTTGYIYMVDNSGNLLKCDLSVEDWDSRVTVLKANGADFSAYWVFNDQFGQAWVGCYQLAANKYGVWKIADIATSGHFNTIGSAAFYRDAAGGRNKVEVVGNRAYCTDVAGKLYRFDLPTTLTGYLITSVTSYAAGSDVTPRWTVLSDGVYFLKAGDGIYHKSMSGGTETKKVAFVEAMGTGYFGAVSDHADTMYMVGWVADTFKLAKYDRAANTCTLLKTYTLPSASDPGPLFEHRGQLFYVPQINVYQIKPSKNLAWGDGGVAWARKPLPRVLCENFWSNDHRFKVNFNIGGGVTDFYLWFLVGGKTENDLVADTGFHNGFKVIYNSLNSTVRGIYGTLGNGTTEQTLLLTPDYLEEYQNYTLEAEYLPDEGRVDYLLDNVQIGSIETGLPSGTINTEDEFIFNSYCRAWGNMNEVEITQLKFYKSA